MNEKNKTKIAFFFGAGVEGIGNFDMEMGFDYLQKSLFTSVFAEKNKKSNFMYFLDKRWKGLSFFNRTYSYSSDTVDAVEFLMKNFIIQR